MTNSGEASIQRFNAATFRQGSLHSYNVGVRPTGDHLRGGRNLGRKHGRRSRHANRSGLGRARWTSRWEHGASALASAGGAIWVSNTAAGTVSRIDPSTNKVVATIKVGNAPAGIAEEGGLGLGRGASALTATSYRLRQTAVRSSTGRRTTQPTRLEISVGSLRKSTGATGARSRAMRTSSAP